MLRTDRPRIPILMYHRISSAPELGVHPYFRVNTSTAVFDAQLRFLKENGYSALTLDQALNILSAPDRQERKYVVLTFDDGYRDFHTDALPLLQQHGFTATVFLPTGYIGDRRKTFKNIDCLTWSEVRESNGCGIVFGAHTVTHPQLASLQNCEARDEIVRSKEQIENRLGLQVHSFSYPFQFPEANTKFVAFLQKTLELAGYCNGVSTIVGGATPKDSPFFLKRLPINNDDDIPLFRAKLQGDYDWVHAPQYFAKRMKRVLAVPRLLSRTGSPMVETNAQRQ